MKEEIGWETIFLCLVQWKIRSVGEIFFSYSSFSSLSLPFSVCPNTPYILIFLILMMSNRVLVNLLLVPVLL